MNVNNVMKDLIKNETSKGTLNWFMRGRNFMNVNIAMKDLMKKKTSKGTLNDRFMSGRNPRDLRGPRDPLLASYDVIFLIKDLHKNGVWKHMLQVSINEKRSIHVMFAI